MLYLIMSINKAFNGMFSSIAQGLTALNLLYAAKIDNLLKQIKALEESKK